MERFARVVAVALVAAALGAWSSSPALGIGDAENAPATLVGGGWVAIGDVEDREANQARDRVHLGVQLPCPGEDVGFNPQPDPPGRLQVTWGQQSFHLDAMTAASCSNNLHEGSGTGRCGDDVGFVINWHLVDGDRDGIGNPDTSPDSVQLEIRGPEDSACALSLTGALGGGNLSMRAPRKAD